jgi:hypothetical protein
MRQVVRVMLAVACSVPGARAVATVACCRLPPGPPPRARRAGNGALALCALVVAVTMLGAAAQYCSPGMTQAECSFVLVVYAEYAPWVPIVQATLRGTGAFSSVDFFDANAATPTASQLAAYHAVFVYSWLGFSDAALLGDRLATYHDQGGGVVVVFAANHANGYNLRGAYGTVTNGYALMNYAQGGFIYPSDALGEVKEPQSPLMAGVASLSAGEAYRSTAPVISGRGVVVARWRGGGQEPLVTRGTRGNRTLVELNFYPPSSSARSPLWSGDGAALMRNAIKYSRCMLCEPGTFAAAGGEGRVEKPQRRVGRF